MAAVLDPPPFVPPSKSWQGNYFFGIPGLPKLVARLGSQLQYPSEAAQIHLYPIGGHSLAQCIKATENDTPSLREEIRSAISNLKWTSINYVRVGVEESNAVATILITISPGTLNSEEAELPLTRVWRACSIRGIIDFEITIMEAILEQLGSSSSLVPSDPYDQYPRCGASIGLDSTPGAGTLGVYVSLKTNKEEVETYMLTNHHVVFPDEPSRSTPQIFNANTNPELAVRTNSPANCDHRRLLKNLHDGLESTQETYNVDKQEIERKKTACEHVRRSEEFLLAENQIMINDYNRRIQDILSFERFAGRVAFSSGKRLNAAQNFMDWALISPDPVRYTNVVRPQNNFPRFDFHPLQIEAINKGTKEKRYRFNMEAKNWKLKDIMPVATIFDAAEDARKVLKCGRTTGWTAGLINGIRSDFHRVEDNLLTTEIIVLNLTSEAFCISGDSGSIVTDLLGRVVGLLHSSTSRNLLGSVTTLITPIEAVIEDIKQVTGATEVVIEVGTAEERDENESEDNIAYPN